MNRRVSSPEEGSRKIHGFLEDASGPRRPATSVSHRRMPAVSERRGSHHSPESGWPQKATISTQRNRRGPQRSQRSQRSKIRRFVLSHGGASRLTAPVVRCSVTSVVLACFSVLKNPSSPAAPAGTNVIKWQRRRELTLNKTRRHKSPRQLNEPKQRTRVNRVVRWEEKIHD